MIRRRNSCNPVIRWKLLLSVFIAHAAVIAPVCWGFSAKAKKENITAIHVNLGSELPSHAPDVGEPMRTPPAAPAPEPPAPEPPAPEPPAPPPPKKAVTPPKKVVKPKKKVVKPRKKVVKPKKKVVKPRKKVVKPRKKVVTPKKRVVKKVVRKEPDVFHDSRWDNFDPNSSGRNTNKNVPIGRRDQGQRFGRSDNRTPASGKAVNDAEYFAKLGSFLKSRWHRPPGVLVDEETAVLIYVRVSAQGRVLSKRIEKESSNPSVTRSVKAMLDSLDYIPRPPAGESEFTLKMVAED